MLARLQQRYMENLKTAAGGLLLLLASLAGGLGVVAYVSLVEGNLMLISALPSLTDTSTVLSPRVTDW